VVLNDREIVKRLLNGEIIITPMINPIRQIGSSSVDLRLGTRFKIVKVIKYAFFDPQKDIEEIKKDVLNYTENVHIAPMEPFILHPKEFVLGSTLEYIKLPPTLVGRLEGRSTWGRAGLQIHSTAGFVDPGFEGILTFELYNAGKIPLPLFAGIRIAQISFHECSKAAIPYSKKTDPKYSKTTEIVDTLFYSEPEYKIIQKYISKNRGKTESEIKKFLSKKITSF
jgi:dCTP deaminase